MATYAFDDFRFPAHRHAARPESRPVPRAPRKSSVLELNAPQSAQAALRAAARAELREELQRPAPKPQPAPRPAEAAHAEPTEVRLVPAQATPGFVALPGTGRLVWWTGRVAIGLRYQAPAPSADTEMGQSAEWIQSMLLH